MQNEPRVHNLHSILHQNRLPLSHPHHHSINSKWMGHKIRTIHTPESGKVTSREFVALRWCLSRSTSPCVSQDTNQSFQIIPPGRRRSRPRELVELQFATRGYAAVQARFMTFFLRRSNGVGDDGATESDSKRPDCISAIYELLSARGQLGRRQTPVACWSDYSGSVGLGLM